MQPDPNSPLLDALVSRFRDQEALLVFDSCEHLIERCAELAGAFVGSCPRLTILATSREELMIQGETTYRLDPLSVPLSGSPSADIETLSQYETVTRFIDRARVIGRDFQVDATTAPWLAEICAKLDGIPLALELAAAQLRCFLSLHSASAQPARPMPLSVQRSGSCRQPRMLQSGVSSSEAAGWPVWCPPKRGPSMPRHGSSVALGSSLAPPATSTSRPR